MDWQPKIRVVFSHLDPKRNNGILFDNHGKCPKCESTRTGIKTTLEEEAFTSITEYECLMCGAQWQETVQDHEAEKRREQHG